MAQTFDLPFTDLLLATLVLAAAGFISRLRPHWPLWVHIVWRFLIFAILTLLVQRMLGSPLHPHFSGPPSGTTFWEHIVEGGWWLLAASVAISMVRLLVVLEHRPRETQIMSDLLAGAILVATLLAIVNFVIGVPIAGLLATSGVIAIVLGLASQNTLADVFSGIAVGIEGPYKAGDLLWIEGDIEGHVMQVTWRSTHIATGHGNIAIVPNSVVAKARLVNRSLPVPTRGDTVEVRLDAAVLPERCMDILLAAARSAQLPLANPVPTVTCTGLAGDGAGYSISYAVASSDVLGAARTEILAQIHRHLRYAGIALALPPGSGLPHPPSVPSPAEILAQSDLFGTLPATGRDCLASHFHPAWLEPQQALFEEGGTPQYLFLIASGVVEISRKTPVGRHVVRRMSPGESLGAIGLFMNTPYIATATALTAVKVFRIDRSAVATAIATVPDLSVGLEELAHRSQLVLARDAAADTSPHTEPPDELRSRLRHVLRLLVG